MNMQQLMAQAQKMQKTMQKAQEALEQKEFSVTSGGAVTIKFLGNREILAIEINEDIINKEDKDMLQDMIKLTINDAMKIIDDEQEKIQANMPGLPGF